MTGGATTFRNDHELVAARALRRSRSGSMRQFAEALRTVLGRPALSAASIHQWESGASRMPADVLLAAAQIAGVSLDSLIAESAAPIQPVASHAKQDAVALIAAARMLQMPVEELLQAIDRPRKSRRR